MGRAVKQDTAPKKTVPSRQWSCSELQDGHAKLLEIKSEKLSPDEMQKQIDEAYHNNMCRVFLGSFGATQTVSPISIPKMLGR
jgi:hypothetical protein